MKIAMDTPYAGRMFLCFHKKHRFLWSRHRQPLEISGHDDAVIAAELGKFCGVEFVDFAGAVEKIALISFKQDGDEVVGGYVGFVQAVVDLLGGYDFVNKELDAIGGSENFTSFRKPGDFELREQIPARGVADRLKFKPRHCGDRVGLVVDLENATPFCVDGSACERVHLAKSIVVEFEPTDQAKRPQTSRCPCDIAERGASNDAVELSFSVQDGKASGIAGKGVVALVVYGGQYFAVDGEGCHSVDSLREHIGGDVGEDGDSANSQMLGYFVKYFAKSVDRYLVEG